MVDLKGKRVLLFVPNGRGIYGTGIMHELERRGAMVTIYDERPSQSTVAKISLRLAKKLFSLYFKYYIRSIISENQGCSFDYILIIRGEAFTPEIVADLKKAFQSAKFILYLWDSVAYRDTTKIFPYFDKILSYDKKDVAEHAEIQHRALFYLDEYRDVAAKAKTDLDVAFVGTTHSDRYAVIMALNKGFEKAGLKSFFYFYFPSRLLFLRKKILDKSFASVPMRDFQFKLISSMESAKIVGRAKVTIDLQSPLQVGLTMRTLEVLGAKRKLITTNEMIRTYDFYDDRNILVIDRKNPKVDLGFFETPFVDVKEDIYIKYSLQGWVNDVFLI